MRGKSRTQSGGRRFGTPESHSSSDNSFLATLSDILGNNFLSSLDTENTEQQGHRSTYFKCDGCYSQSNGAGRVIGIVVIVVACFCTCLRVLQ